MSRHQFRGKSPAAPHAAAALSTTMTVPMTVDAVTATPPLQSVEDRALIRLELLRLAHRHDQEPKTIVERAQALEAYVFSEPAADKF